MKTINKSKHFHLKKAVMLFLILTLSLTSNLTACGCSGERNIETIQAASMFTHEKLELPIEGRDALVGALESDGWIIFKSKASIGEIYRTLSQLPEITVSQFDDAVFIVKPSLLENCVNYYCVSECGSQYVFGGMRSRIITDIDSDGREKELDILLPIHLISDKLILESSWPYSLYANVDYKAQGDINDFFEFYNAAGWYDVSVSADEITIHGYREGVSESVAERGIPLDDALILEHPVIIKFTERDGEVYFSVSQQQGS